MNSSTALEMRFSGLLSLSARNVEVLRSRTSHAARLREMEGRIGCRAHGAFADFVLVDGDTLSDPGLLAQSGRLPLVVQAGRVVQGQS